MWLKPLEKTNPPTLGGSKRGRMIRKYFYGVISPGEAGCFYYVHFETTLLR